MVQGVYVDILLVSNFLVDFLLLSLLARAGGRGTQGGWRRVAAGSGGIAVFAEHFSAAFAA